MCGKSPTDGVHAPAVIIIAASEQEHWAGLAFYGQIDTSGSSKLVYSAAYLLGATSVLSDNRAILRVEYGFF